MGKGKMDMKEQKIKFIGGGVCAPKGFTAAGVRCGIRKGREKKDLALIFGDCDCTAAAVYTTNLVQGAPLAVTKAHLADGHARAVICNSGNANTCNANGEELAEETCRLAAAALGIDAKEMIVASTGVIGQAMDIAPFVRGIPALVSALGDHSDHAAEAIMTTDSKRKELAVEFTLGGVPCRLGGIAKGSGMIHPNMATMLVFLTTDAAISSELLQRALREDTAESFHMVSVDGDTSTNDMVSILASGRAGNAVIDAVGEDFNAFKTALAVVTQYLCRAIAADGEGATKLLECRVTGAADSSAARAAAKAVVCSSLVKAAMFGADANWGRVLCALGYCGAPLEVSRIGVRFCSAAGDITVCENGMGVPFGEEQAKKLLSEKEIGILVSLGQGEASAVAWGCDLTYDYVKINGDYRT
jgi:glutamate N-acetyltransferase/amino-acid N-acetyltransferase